MSSLIIIDLSVDDLLISSKERKAVKHVKAKLSSKFQIKDLKDTRMIIGFEISRDQDKKVLNLKQTIYIYKVLECFNMLN